MFDYLAVRLLVVLLLVLANAFFVAAEFSLVASRRTRIEAMIRRGDAKAKFARRAILSLNRMISATQLGITAASLGLGWLGEPAVAQLLRGVFEFLPSPADRMAEHGFASLLAFAAITFLHITLGELTPKALGLVWPERVAGWTAGPLLVFSYATNPFIWLLNRSANLVLRLFGTRTPSEIDRLHSAEELRMLVEQSRRAGTIEKDDARLLAGVFEFSEKNAREVMTPRTQMIALHESDSLAQAADTIAAAGRSRYPVYRESLDDITGIVHAKDVLAALRASDQRPLATLLRPAQFVPGSREIEDVLADMKLRKTHMVIVLDEFGGTAGLVTMEDLLEEIVGQIEDEYDRPARVRVTPLPQPAGSMIFAGSSELADVAEKTRIELISQDYTTLGGFVFGALGRLPKVGDRVTVPGGVFEVTAMEGKRVGEARFSRKS